MERRRFLACCCVAPAIARAGESDDMLYMLTYDHGGLVLWGMDSFQYYLDTAVQWMDRYPSFKIGLDNEAYTYDYMAEQNPKLLEKLRGILTRYRGRFGIGTCTYGQPLMGFINEESNIRQIGYARDTERTHFGWTPEIYLMSEQAMHAQIPQILLGFGFQGAIMRTHFMMYGYNPTFDLAIGWWVGLDGSRIPAVPTYKGEGAEFGAVTDDNRFLTRYPTIVKFSPEDFKKKFARIKPLLATRADDAGLRQEGLVKEYEGRPGYRWILLEEILPNFPAPTQDMKTAPDDFHLRMPWGYCGNEIWNQNRRAEVGVLTAERLAALEHLLDGEDHEDELRRSWKNLLVGQHHDIQITGRLRDAHKFLGQSIEASNHVTQASMRYVAARMQGGGAAQVTVFNPHSWPRQEWVEASLALPGGPTAALEVRRGGKVIPSVVLGIGEITQLAIFADVPAMGFSSYSVVPAESAPRLPASGIAFDESNLSVHTPHWNIRLHPEGGFVSLKDRRTGQEFLKSDRRSGFFAGKIEGADCESKGKWSLVPGPRGAPWMTAREVGSVGGIPYTLSLVLRADSPRLDFNAEFHFQNQRIGVLSDRPRDPVSGFIHEAKLRFKLFWAVEDGATGVRDVPFGVAETANPYVEGIYWAALSDGRTGAAIFNRGSMGTVREKDGGFSIPLAFAMYYVWGTRMLNGYFNYEFALHPFAGEWGRAGLHRGALEYNFPFVAVGTGPGDGRLGNETRLLESDSSAAIVSALYTAGGRTYARLFEYQGRPVEVELRYLKGPARLADVDLAGNETKLIASPLALRPWQFRTVRIEPLRKEG
jgi:alpha-mannosidase